MVFFFAQNILISPKCILAPVHGNIQISITWKYSVENQTVRFSENLGIFFPNSWEIDENTHNFLTRQFGEIFPVNPYNLQNMAKVNSHSHEKIWENTNIQKLRVS